MSARARTLATALILVAGCKSKRAARPPADAAAPVVAADASAGPSPWASVDAMPKIRPRWTVTLPALPVPASDLHGPVMIGGAAVVAGSAIGITGVDARSGATLFTRPGSGGRIAAPVPLDEERLLAIADCTDPVDVPESAALIGCYAVMDARVEAVYGAGSIVAPAADAAAIGTGPLLAVRWPETSQVVWLSRPAPEDEHPSLAGRTSLRWLQVGLGANVRGELHAALVPPLDGPLPPSVPRATVGVGDAQVDVWSADDVLEVRFHDPQAVSNRASIIDVATAPGGVQALADGTIRVFQLVPGERAIQPARFRPAALRFEPLGAAVPGIQLLAAAGDDRGYAIAVRLDTTLQHDVVVGFTAAGVVAWAYPLPAPPGGGRALRVGLALSDEGVVVFYDGTTLAGLPRP